MKINSNNLEALKAYGASSVEQTQLTKESGGRLQDSVSIKDKINISSKVKMFQDIRQAALDAPDIRDDKVKDVEQKISSGTYKPDYNAIADRLLSQSISAKI
ncbi:MAG TPA: flagellar biosynthesis anti-sigma factor FlgM [Deltaproteobacteria bacterium]|jgi:flagellar biosynthesis anti-sigma factor FlgM|nr:flagellar biosynthesis anti-sigma factor FlgM [Deltaproteobacteria bacterium]